MSRPGGGAGGIGDRLGGQDLPGDRPGDRFDNRPGDRPIRPNNDFGGNINNRPDWVNIDIDQINNIHNRWGNSFNNRDWQSLSSDRRNYWDNRGDRIRDDWQNHHLHDDWFDNDWWDHHDHDWCGWHYHDHFHDYGDNYWWTIPAWGAVSSWWNWSTYPQTAWSQPVYYDYGDGGNVTYQDNYVYIGGEQICTTDEFAQSAAELATVAPPEDEAQAEAAEWMPLGTFAVVGHEQEQDPSRILQLAVDKTGIISGTLYNSQTDQAQSVQGQVDKETQRAAFRLADSEDIVVETGIYNLTQEETPILVHFGSDKVETWMLVRLEQPTGADTAGG